MEAFIRVINTINAIAFVVGLTVALASILGRFIRYRMARQPLPVLLPRDLVLIFGLAFPIAAVLLARFSGIQGLGDNIIWVSVVGGVPVLAIWVWVFFELFVIEKG